MDPQTAKAALTGLLRDLDGSARTLRGEHAGESSELSHYDQHPADIASDLSDQDREAAAIEVVHAQQQEVEAALRRIEEGSYGRCVDCGQQLPEERLDARPEAARCVNCQAKAEAAR